MVAAVSADLSEYDPSLALMDKWPDGAVRALDVSADGIADWLIDFEAFGFPAWCGTGGCRRQLWVSHEGRHVLAFDAQALEFSLRTAAAPPVIDVELHGVHCNGTGADSCPRAFMWNAATGRLDETANRAGGTRLSGSLFQPVPVDEATLPPPVAAARDSGRQACVAAGGRYEEFDMPVASVPDLDGDGERDWIVDGSLTDCETASGNAPPAPIRVFLSGSGQLREAAALPADAYDIDVGSRPAKLLPRSAEHEAARLDVAVIDAAIRAFLQREKITAAHVSVLQGSSVILRRGYGSAGADGKPPEESTVFPLGSISKQFTAATILALTDSGQLRLDARVGDYLPEWFGDEPDLRIEHLLSQTSGLADFLWLEGYRPLADNPATPIAAYVALAAAAPRKFAPGTRWSYSNTNYKALALIIERVTRQSFDDVVAAKVLRPAGISGIAACHSLPAGRIVPGISSEGRPAPLDASRAAYAGDGGLCGNAAALARWLEVGYAGRNGVASRLARSVRLKDGTEVPYGFGVSTRKFLGAPAVWHGGNVDGHSSMIAYLPEDDLRLVILTNRGFVWLTEVMPALVGKPPPGRGKASGAPPKGEFEDGLFRYSVTSDGDGLQVEIDLIGRLQFIPAGPREYIAEKYPATFRIRQPPDGSGEAFEVDWGEVRSYARRVERTSAAAGQ